jgi:hypothetical protein
MARIVAADLDKLTAFKVPTDADLDLYIDLANQYVNRYLQGLPEGSPFSEAELANFELLITAHYIAASKIGVQSASQSGTSVTFRGDFSEVGFGATQWGQMAVQKSNGILTNKTPTPFDFGTSSSADLTLLG